MGFWRDYSLFTIPCSWGYSSLLLVEFPIEFILYIYVYEYLYWQDYMQVQTDWQTDLQTYRLTYTHDHTWHQCLHRLHPLNFTWEPPPFLIFLLNYGENLSFILNLSLIWTHIRYLGGEYDHWSCKHPIGLGQCLARQRMPDAFGPLAQRFAAPSWWGSGGALPKQLEKVGNYGEKHQQANLKHPGFTFRALCLGLLRR